LRARSGTKPQSIRRVGERECVIGDAIGTQRRRHCRYIPSSDENTDFPIGGDVEIPARRRLIGHHLAMKTTGQITVTYICAAFDGETSRASRK